MYDLSSIVIAVALFVSMALAIEAGYRIGRGVARHATEASRVHVNAIQAALLGVLALLLAFTLSLALQRFDSRSAAVVDEANAIGTAYLRTQLLPPSLQAEARASLVAYVDLRLQEGATTPVERAERQATGARTAELQNALWRYGVRAAELDGRPVTSGLFIQSVNDLIDSNGRRNAALARHVPEVVLFLLYGTFLLTGTIVGYAAGLTGQRASYVTYIMVALIVMLVFIIIDLDRPRRGLIEIDQSSLRDLRASMTVGGGG